MRAVVTRVSSASVTIDGAVHGKIGPGFLILLGVGPDDTEQHARKLAEKILGLRIFEDEDGKINRDLSDVGGSVLVISQFTLFADCRKGNRPSFVEAAPPEFADQVYREVVAKLRARLGEERVGTGVFRAHMEVRLLNDGPVTIQLDV